MDGKMSRWNLDEEQDIYIAAKHVLTRYYYFIYLFIYLWLHQVLVAGSFVAARGLFAEARGGLSCPTVCGILVP